MTADERHAEIMDALATVSEQAAALHESLDNAIAEIDDLRSIVARIEGRIDELA